MITIQDARSGRIIPIDEIMKLDYYQLFIDHDDIKITLVESTTKKNKGRIRLSPEDGYEHIDNISIFKKGLNFYLYHTDRLGVAYRRELTQVVVDDYKLKVRIEY